MTVCGDCDHTLSQDPSFSYPHTTDAGIEYFVCDSCEADRALEETSGYLERCLSLK